MRLAQASPLGLSIGEISYKVDGVEVSLHLVCLRLAEPPHGEVHPVREVAECAVPLCAAPVRPEPVLRPDAVLQDASIGLARLPGSLPGDGLLAVGVPPLVWRHMSHV